MKAAAGGGLSVDTGPVSGPGRPPGDVVTVLVSILGLVIGVVAAVLAAPAARNDGTPGTFTAHGESCDRHTGCWWDGTFESDDGRVFADESMKSQELRAVGDQVRAQRVNGEVFRRGSQAWVPFALAAAACLAYLLWFVGARRRYRRRPAVPSGGPTDPGEAPGAPGSSRLEPPAVAGEGLPADSATGTMPSEKGAS